ncbi:MAG: tetratricopeptide repeat protein, partial [Bacteroidia bacterium]|nr:tetratricopeptide repeat protein [Bacteroidia bacterium]
PTNVMKTTYQKVTYYRGLQLLNANQPAAVKSVFKRSLQIKNDPDITALTHFWLGDIAFKENLYDQSIRELTTFKSTMGPGNAYPDISSAATASYMLGYNFMRKNDFRNGLKHFKDAITNVENNTYSQTGYVKETVYQDAIVRAGDCEFMNKRYPQSIQYYNMAIRAKSSSTPYALFQKATLLGLQKKSVDKLLTLEDIINDYPGSEYVDDALLESGNTYLDIGQINKALDPLRTLVSDYKDRSNLVNKAYLQLGLISYNQGDLRASIKNYKAILSNNPTPGETESSLAALKEIYVVDLNQPDEYVAVAEDVPGYDIGEAEKDRINFNAAMTQYENGKYEDAVSSFTSYLRKYPRGQHKLGALYYRGESYAVLEQYANAYKDYENTIRSGQSQYYAKALAKAAVIAYNFNEDFYKSYDLYKQLESVAENEETRFTAQLGAMRSAYRTNNKAGVFGMADKVASNPRASKTERAAAHFYKGKILYDEAQWNKSKEELNQVTKLSDNEQTAEARYLISSIYYKQKELDIAQQLCINANKESSNYPYWVAKSVLLLSDIFVDKKDLINARAALEALLDGYKEDQAITAEAQIKLDKVNRLAEQDSKLLKEPSNPNVLELEQGGFND